MPCYHPITAYRSPRCVDAKSGKAKLFFKEIKVKAWPGYETLQVPCGQCIGCRLERSRQWAIRCVHESKLYEDNCFITLTYSSEFLPKDGSLDKSAFQKFMKRLRKYIAPKRVRFFHCGEYGDKGGRPHYHACLFGYDFPDKEFYSERDGCRLYISPLLQELWPFGYSTVGAVTFESAAYVARYIMKKINGDPAKAHYAGRSPEYTTMSRRPGVGKGWYTEFREDVFPCDNVVLRGKVMRPPKFYDRCFEVDSPDEFVKIKSKRKAKALECADDNTPERLKVKEVCKRSQCSQLKRGIENET